MNADLVHQVCTFLREEVELVTGEHSHCHGCRLRVESPYGSGPLLCVMRAQQLIALVQESSAPCPVHGDRACLRWYLNGVHAHPSAPDALEWAEGDLTDEEAAACSANDVRLAGFPRVRALLNKHPQNDERAREGRGALTSNQICTFCGAADNGTCAYPSEGKPGCLLPAFRERTRAALDEIVRLSEEAGLYDLPPSTEGGSP